MAITDSKAAPAETASRSAHEIRTRMINLTNQIETNLNYINSLIVARSRSSIDTSLGADKADFAKQYNVLRTYAQNNGRTIPALPS